MSQQEFTEEEMNAAVEDENIRIKEIERQAVQNYLQHRVIELKLQLSQALGKTEIKEE